jgi:hypothetical protein
MTVEEGNRIYIGAQSVESKLLPEVKGVVRGEIIIAGWVLEQLQDAKTKCVYISSVIYYFFFL